MLYVRPILDIDWPMVSIRATEAVSLITLDQAAQLRANLRTAIQHSLKLHELVSDPNARPLLLSIPGGEA